MRKASRSVMSVRRPQSTPRAFVCLIILAVISALFISSTRVRVVEALSVTMLGVPITQNFDTLPASGSATFVNDSTLPGWYSARTGTGTTIVANDGTSNAGNLYSYGTGTSTDRALGSIGSSNAAAGNFFWGILLTNNTGSTITSLDVAYTGEQWRNSAAAAQTVAFSYITGASITGSLADFQAAGTNVTALDFTSPITGGTAAALNGNLAANRTAKSFTISGVNLADGQSILLRWSDPDHSGADHGLSIDDFSVTPNGGVVQPTLNINDVTQAEGDSGQTAFNFTVSLSSPAGVGGVTFDASTADGTANAGSDYVGFTNQPFTILEGNSSATVTVQVNGDTTPEPNETFFVNIANVVGATAGDTQGLGTITNDDVTLTAIHTIQGSGSTSPLVTQSVTTRGIVTGIKLGSSGGFFIQEPDATVDADPNTSEGVFVFTGASVPAAVVIGNFVQVTGTVQEFVFASDPNSPPITEISGSPTVNLLSTGNAIPGPHVITAADTTAPSGTTNPLDSLEEFEGMRVQVNSLTVTGPTQGSITEPSATVASTGVFFGVVTGVPRPFREPGVLISDPLPPGAPANVPRFDENPERIRVDSDGQPSTTALDVTAGTIITNLIGELDYSFRAYSVLPEAANPPSIGTQPGSIPVPTPTADELTVASFNMERFFDTVNDPATSDPVLTAAAFSRRVAKASLIIRTVENLPDVIGVEEMENLSTLQTVAAQVNSDVVGGGGVDPQYQAYLVEGNDIGGIDVGFLVKSSRVTQLSVTQLELAGCDHVTPSTCNNYVNPNTGALDILNDRPPLVLVASIPRAGGGLLGFTVIVNHLRSLNGIDDTTVDGSGTVGARVRDKRRKQAEFLANYIQGRQTANPNEKIITVGDMNAFRVNDGYVDSIGTILGTPAPADQVVLASSDLVNPDQTDLVDTLPAAQQYSYNFDGNAQTLDHIIINPPALAILNRFAYARNDSDFAVKNYESTNELRISDHDQPVAYFSLSAPTAANGIITGRVTTAAGVPVAGAVVNLAGSQTRKTITDANGNYRFNGVEANGFYTVTPACANFNFNPANRSFNQLSEHTEATFTASAIGETANPLDTPEYFVRQQYLDLLGREPDEGGFNYWSDQLLGCGNDVACQNARRRDVAAAFFIEAEFQRTGSYLYGLYQGALGRQPLYQEFASDRQQVVDGPNLEETKQLFAETFVGRTEFVSRYQSSATAESFVEALLASVRQASGIDLSGERGAIIDRYNSGTNLTQSRSRALRAVSENTTLRQAEYNAAFVLTEYFGYLRRDPDAGGYAFWLDVLNHQEAGNYRGMVCAFTTSAEYQQRFSAIVSRSNRNCGQ